MSTEKQRNALLNVNRLLIYGFGLLGLFFASTLAYVISMTLWVWLPNCIQFERHVFIQWRSHLMPISIKSPQVDTKTHTKSN